MLATFIADNRATIVANNQKRASAREGPKPTEFALLKGIPIFVDQVCDALKLAESSDEVDHGQITESAGQYGRDLLALGFSVQQVVHGYGDVCQTITALAV